jgi:FixJ family two-component response regulator
MITRRECELARIRLPTRNPGSRRHSGLRPRRASDPCGRVPDHLFVKAKPKVVALIDDDPGVRGAISRLLWPLGYDTELYGSAKEFLDAAMTTEAICLIVDIGANESRGIEFAQRLVTMGFTTPIIFTTADDDESFKRRAGKMGCVAFLPKPFSADGLSEVLRNIPGHPDLGADQTSQGRAVDTRLFARWRSRRLATAPGVLQRTILRIRRALAS